MFRTLLLLLAICIMASCQKSFDAFNGDTDGYTFDPSIIESQDTVLEATFLINASKDPLISYRSWEGIPSIAADSSGKNVYVAWYSGGKGEGSGNFVTVSVSKDKGKTWMNDRLVVYPKNPKVRFFDPSLWCDKFNNVWLFFAKSNTYWDGKGGVWGMRIRWGTNAMLRSKPQALYNGVMMNKPLDLSDQDSVLLPISIWDKNPTTGVVPGAYIFRAGYDDHTLHFNLSEEYAVVRVPQAIRTFDEHLVTNTSVKGQLLCFVRTKEGMHYCRSLDDGKHWGTLLPFTAIGNNADSRFNITKLRSGRLMMVVNNSNQRTDMTVLLSEDDGVTWPKKIVIDTRKDISYPDAIETTDGYIHIVYDRDRYGAKEIIYTRLTEKDILLGKEKNVYKRVVNKP
jgi:predicted neuraminidase